MSEDYDRPRRPEAVTSGKAIASLVCGLLFAFRLWRRLRPLFWALWEATAYSSDFLQLRFSPQGA
jgi:hypothetical protein